MTLPIPASFNFSDGRGGLLPDERMDLIRKAAQTLDALTEFERGYVLCWFCRNCHRYVGPGDACHCNNDE